MIPRTLFKFIIVFMYYDRLLARTGSGVRFSIEPESPLPDEMVSLKCAVISPEVVNFHYMAVSFGNKPVVMVKYELGTAEAVGEWKSRNTEVKYDSTTKTLSVDFRARRNDTGKVECRVQVSSYPNYNKDIIAVKKFLVKQQPRIISLRLFGRPENSRRTTTFVEGEKMKVVCIVDLGWPVAKVALTRFNPSDSGEVTSTRDNDKYGYNRTTRSIIATVSSKENGKFVECTAYNALRRIYKREPINVLFGVKALRFRYHNGQQMQVGTALVCAANGNPTPLVNLTVVPIGNSTHRVDGSRPRWTLNSTLGYGDVKKIIPESAPVGTYGILCTAKNTVRSKKYMQKSEFVRINVTGIKAAGMGLILGVTIPAAIFFLLILFCCCRSYQRKKKDRRAEEAGHDRKEDGINSSPPRGGPSTSGMGSSYQREEEPECPTTPLTNYSTPRKPPRSITSSSSRGLNHWPNSMDSRDAYSPADGASVPFTDDAIVHEVNTSKAHEGEAEEEFV